MIQHNWGPLALLAIAMAAFSASISVPVENPSRLARNPVTSPESLEARRFSENAIRVAERPSHGD